MPRLTRALLLEAVTELCNKDKHFERIVVQHGPPPLWSRKTGFASLVMIILEQQVSLASARSAFKRLRQKTGELTPQKLLLLSEEQVRACGITRQKASYIYGLAESIVNGEIDLTAIHRADDTLARQELTRIRGVGLWTADIYLMMAMGRPDIWPQGDLALAEAVRRTKGLQQRPDVEKQLKLAECWRPWRSVAARLFWHSYLSTT